MIMIIFKTKEIINVPDFLRIKWYTLQNAWSLIQKLFYRRDIFYV